MKNACLFFVSFFLVLKLSAQITGVKMEESQEFNLPLSFNVFSKTHFSNTDVGCIVDHYISGTKKMPLASIDLKNGTVKYEMKTSGFDDVNKAKVFQFNGSSYLVTYEHDKKAKKESVYFQKIDFRTNNFIGERKLLITSDAGMYGFFSATKVKAGYEATSIPSPGYIDLSTDKTKFVYYYKLDGTKDDKELAKMCFTVFDQNLNKLWTKTIEVPFLISDKLRYTVDTKGDLYVCVKEYKDKRSNGSEEELNIRYSLLKLTKDSDKFQKMPLPNFGKLLTRVNFYESPNGELYLGGFYVQSLKDWVPGGLLIYQIQNSNIVVRVRAKLTVPPALIKEKMDELKVAAAAIYAVNLYEFHIKDIRITPENKFLVTGYGSIWGTATSWCDFQLGTTPFIYSPFLNSTPYSGPSVTNANSASQSSVGQSNSTKPTSSVPPGDMSAQIASKGWSRYVSAAASNSDVYTGFNEQDPIVLLADSNSIIWSHHLSNTYFVSDALVEGSSGFLIDKNNSVYCFTRAYPEGEKAGVTGWKKRPVEDIKLVKMRIDGTLETQVVTNKEFYLSCGFSNVNGIVNQDANKLFFVLGGTGKSSALVKVITLSVD